MYRIHNVHKLKSKPVFQGGSTEVATSKIEDMPAISPVVPHRVQSVMRWMSSTILAFAGSSLLTVSQYRPMT